MPELNDHIDWLYRSAERMKRAAETLKEPELTKFLEVGAQTHLDRAQELVNHLKGGHQLN